MKIGVYVINLDEATKRWESVVKMARRTNVEVIRVAGVDARSLPASDFIDVDWPGFRRHGGRDMLPGEYGCYRSHLRCLAELARSHFDAAIIMEDDVRIAADTTARTAAAFEKLPDAHVIKLFNHRNVGFRKIAETSFGDELGRCLHGPLGSAGCYAVRRSAAPWMLSALQEMVFPFDVALEYGWHYGGSVYTVRTNLATSAAISGDSQIGRRDDYRRMKYRGIRRLPTHAARAHEYGRRLLYVLCMNKRNSSHGDKR